MVVFIATSTALRNPRANTRSGFSSALRSASVSATPLKTGGARYVTRAKLPSPLPRTIVASYCALPVTRSRSPSLLKSPVASEYDWGPDTYPASEKKVPSPFPIKTASFAYNWFAIARSDFPSRLKSATITVWGSQHDP